MRVWVVEFLDMYEWLRVPQQLLPIERSTDAFAFLSSSSNYRMSFFSFHRINARKQNMYFFPFQKKSAMWVCYRKISCWEKKATRPLDTWINSIKWRWSVLGCMYPQLNPLTLVLFSIAEGPAESKSLSAPIQSNGFRNGQPTFILTTRS